MLELAQPRPAWMGAAHDGRLTLPDGRVVPVVVVLGPEGADEAALQRARSAASVPLSLRHAGVVRLLHVTLHEGQVAWCYEPFEGFGLGHTIGREGRSALTARAAAEAVAQVAEVLLGLGAPGLMHPGPEATDLLLSPTGRVGIIGFAGPHPVGPSMRAPNEGIAKSDAVYRLGVLLTTLAAGQPPGSASDAASHGVLVRRALIRTMARPGPVLSDRYGQWLRGMLAWAPAERPPLSAVPAGLRAVGWSTGGIGLAEWADMNVRSSIVALDRGEAPPEAQVVIDDDVSDPRILRALAEPGPPPRRREDTPAREMEVGSRDPETDPEGTETGTPEADPTAPQPLPGQDDRTQEDGTAFRTLDSTDRQPVPRKLPATGARGRLPVGFGPPPEAVDRPPPSLPAGFLVDAEEPSDRSGPVALLTDRTEAVLTAPSSLWVFGLGIALALIGLLFALYLAFGEPGAPPAPVDSGTEGPSLRTGISPGNVEPAPRDPTPDVPAPDLVLLDTDTDGEPFAADTDPPVDAAPPGPVDPRRDRGLYVTFRLAEGRPGQLGVQCDGRPMLQGRRSYLLERLTPGQRCTVWAVDRSGNMTAEDQITVGDRPITVDCFHNGSTDCLD